MKLTRLLVFSVLFTMLFSAGAMAQTIAFAFQDLETEFWVASHHAITETLAAKGIRVIEYNANEDANRQLEQVRDAISQNVDGIILIPQDGESAVTIVLEANRHGVPIGVYNRPPSSREGAAIVVVADNEVIAEHAVDYMVEEARKKYEETGEKLTPAILVGNLGDPNAVYRRQGFYNAMEKAPELFHPVIEVPTNWDANIALANLQNAIQANPDIDFLYSCSDFLFPTVRAVLAPLGKWQVAGHPNHVILGGLDGDATAGALLDDGYVDAVGVQDLFFEAEAMMNAMLAAIEQGDTTPDEWIDDPGFALTRGNVEERRMDMWGNVLRLGN